MVAALLVILAAVLGGALATYLFEERAGLTYRLAVGACLGLTVLGLLGYAGAAWLGMGPVSVALAAMATLGAPLLALRHRLPAILQDVRAGLRRSPRPAHLLLVLAAVVILLRCYDRAMIVAPDGIHTGYVDNYADLTLHLGIITGFLYGENYPPEHPEYAGTRLAYPFLADFVAAMLAAAGAEIHRAMFLQNMVLTTALLVILFVWARRLTGDRTAALLTPALVFLCGGLGFMLLFGELKTNAGSIWHYLTHLPHDYTAHEQRLRWANSLVYWFVPMRSMLLGVPLFLIVTGLWWKALGYEAADGVGGGASPARAAKKGKRAAAPETLVPAAAQPIAPSFSPDHIMLASGLIAGLLALAHPHTGITLGLMGICLMLLTERWRMWIVWGVAFAALFAPQGLWAISGSSVKGSDFFGWYPGWSGHDQAKALAERWVPGAETAALLGKGLLWKLAFAAGVAWYWFENAGLFIPLLLVALVWRGRRPIVRRPLLRFYLPFLFCFIVPNLVKLAPWEWDNMKVLIYWFIPSAPLVALVVSRLWRGRVTEKVAAVVCVIVLTLSGALDIWRVLTGALDWRVFSSEEIALGDVIREKTPPRAVILNAPLHNHPFILSGRRSFYGYPGTLWTHGISHDIYEERLRAMEKIYRGEPEALELIHKYKIDYAVVGPMERQNVSPLSEEFFTQFTAVGRLGDAAIYKLR